MSDQDSHQPNEPKRGTFAGKKGEIIIREHEYDGIQEYDQKLPNWWLFTFYGAIAWFLVHWFLYYQAGMFRTDGQRIDNEMARIAAVKAERLEKMMGEIDDNVIWEMSAH